MTRYYDTQTILKDVPEWAQLQEAMKSLQGFRMPMGVASPALLFKDAIRSDLAAEIPLNEQAVLEHAHRALADGHAREFAFHSLRDMKAELAEEARDIARNNSERIFSAMHTELDRIVSDYRALGDRSTIQTAEDAIATGRVDDYERRKQLAIDYAQLRAAQVATYRKTCDHEISRLEAAAVRNAPTVWPHWAAYSSHGYLESAAQGARTTVRVLHRPWVTGGPELANRRVTLDDIGSEEFLAWAIDAGAELWVPNLAALENEERKLADALLPTARNYNPADEWHDPAAVEFATATRRK